jgi:hypothetical protein
MLFEKVSSSFLSWKCIPGADIQLTCLLCISLIAVQRCLFLEMLRTFSVSLCCRPVLCCHHVRMALVVLEQHLSRHYQASMLHKFCD